MPRRRTLLPVAAAALAAAAAVALGARSFVAPLARPGSRALGLTALRASGGPGPFLVLEEMKETERKRRPRRQIKRRRGRFFVFEEGSWLEIPKEKVMLPPSEDPVELADQIHDSRQVGFLDFLGKAMGSPAFNAGHAALAVTLLARERKHLDTGRISEVAAHPTVAALATAGKELLASDQKVPLRQLTEALHSLSVYRQDLPALSDAMVPELARRVVDVADDLSFKHIAEVVGACADLYKDFPVLEREVLPLFTEQSKVAAMLRFLKKKGPHHYALMDNGFLKLLRERPDMRSWLPRGVGSVW